MEDEAQSTAGSTLSDALAEALKLEKPQASPVRAGIPDSAGTSAQEAEATATAATPQPVSAATPQPAGAATPQGDSPRHESQRPPRPPRENRPPRPQGQGAGQGPGQGDRRPDHRGGDQRGGRGPGGGPVGDRGPDRGGDRGDRGDRREGGRPGGRPFDGPADIELEKLISDSLYLDNQAHAVVVRMRDMDSGTKSQLRRLYNAVRRAVRAPESERQHQFVMLRARLAYTIARHSLRSLDALERLLLQVTRRNDARGYERFKDLFEAIVAYNE
jgi:CRISPR type III-A-associated protein Csm2